MIILLDGKEYAVGLNWFAVSTEEEVAQFQREMDMQYGILKMTKKAGEQSTVALSGPEYADQVSLAGILSYAYKNLLFVTSTAVKNEAGAPLFYLCAVKNGVVAVDGDMIADMETIQSTYQQSLAEMTGDMPMESIERFSCGVDEAAFPDLIPVKLGKVLDTAQRYASACIVKPIAKKALSMATITMVAGAFIVGGYFMFAWVFQEPPPPPVTKGQVVVKKDPFESFMEGFSRTLQTMPRAQIIADFVENVRAAPPVVQGWQVSQVSYSGEAEKEITYQYKRSTYTTVNNLNNALPTTLAEPLDLSDDLDTATVSYPFNVASARIDTAAIKSLNAKKGESNYRHFASLMQANHVLFKTTIDLSLQYFVGNSFTIVGRDLWELQQIGNLLQTLPTLGIKSITLKYNNGQYTWSLEGMVYG